MVGEQANPKGTRKALNVLVTEEDLQDSDEEEEEILADSNAKQVHFHDRDEEHIPRSHFTNTHWARATTKTMVKVDYVNQPVVALVDSGSEINIMSKSLFEKGNWPIDMDHGWRVRTANMSSGDIYGACPNVPITIGDVNDNQNFFIQDFSSYPLILGQPFITALRMEIKVLDNGSAYARIRSRDGTKAVQFLTVCVDHIRNRDSLRDHPLPKITNEFRDFQDFLRVPL